MGHFLKSLSFQRIISLYYYERSQDWTYSKDQFGFVRPNLGKWTEVVR